VIEEKANYRISWMCVLLRVPRSSFYAWRHRAETATAVRRRELAVLVAAAFEGGRGAYDCRRVAAQLNRDGHECSVGLVADLMRELALRACQPRAYKRTTVPGEEPVTSPDLTGRDFTAPAPGQRLVGDITYLRTGEGWLYLATVTGLATRMVVGWQLASHMRTSLITDALAMAVTGGHVRARAVFHSDRRPIHLGPVRIVLQGHARPDQRRADRSVLGQRCRRELLRCPEKRDVLPPVIPHQSPGAVRRGRLHRGLLQPPAAASGPPLPHPRRSP
jgi:putative transposase